MSMKKVALEEDSLNESEERTRWTGEEKKNNEMKSLAFNEHGFEIFVMSAIVTHLYIFSVHVWWMCVREQHGNWQTRRI